MTPPGLNVIVEDEPSHLLGLSNAFARHDVPCRQVLFEGEWVGVGPYPDVRYVFTDLHLGGGALTSGHQTDFSTIGSLFEEVLKPARRYAILLWTMYPAQADSLADYLSQRLEGVEQPVGVRALEKAHFLDRAGRVRDEGELFRAVQDRTASLELLLNKPTPEELERRLVRLFGAPECKTGGEGDSLLALDMALDAWMDSPLEDHDHTPGQMLRSDDAGDVCLLEKVVNGIATSRAATHPSVVAEIVRQRLESLYFQGVSLDVVGGPTPFTEDMNSEFKGWLDSANPVFGDMTPRQFLETPTSDSDRLRSLSARLDAIEDGDFS